MAVRSILQPLDEQGDEALVARWQGGDDLALRELLGRYRPLARAKARTYFLVGADADDIEQEALIGLYKAARDYQAHHQVSFRAFADMCVTRQVISAVKSATRQKHQPLNRYVPIHAARTGAGAGGDAPDTDFDALLEHHPHTADPADEVVSREHIGAVRAAVTDALSGFEAEVLRLHLGGQSYREIGLRLGRHVKAVDNALQRTKRKLDERLQPFESVRGLPLAG